MIAGIFEKNIFKVLSIFSIEPGSRFNRKEIKGKSRLNNIPLDKSLSILKNSGILKRERSLYSVNFESSEWKNIINTFSRQYKGLKEIPLDAYFCVADIVYFLSSIKGVEAYLFGSYSKLVYKEDSDIDVAVLITGNFNKKPLQNIVNKAEKTYKKRVEIHYFDKFNFYKNKKDPLVKDILKNGVRLQ